ncbi:MAG: M24 family metallopeptidase [Isosphaeraceae bacterium]|nr:M24 family metallopeptidase [Isosphaeraceae bacterium]
MSTELEVGTLAGFYGWAGSLEEGGSRGSSRPAAPDSEPVDPVLLTAHDRPSSISLPASADPASDLSDPMILERRADVDEKHRRIIEFLDLRGYDGVLLRRSDSVAWFTAGGDLARFLDSEWAGVAIFVARTCRVVITDNVHSARVFEEELAGLGFQLKERAWHDDPSAFQAQFVQGKRVACDDRGSDLVDESRSLRELRRPLTPLERRHLRELGRTLAFAVESTCRNFMPGETEADLAGHLAHRLLREGVIPVDLRVAGDDRSDRFRRARFKSAAIERRAVISAVGKRHGLCASVTRTVHFGSLDPEGEGRHALASMISATYTYFSRPARPVSEVFQRAKRIYEKFDHPDEWLLDYQGFEIGYTPREQILLPRGTAILQPNTALAWCPSVGSARSEDTIVIDARGFEVITETRNWPKLEVTVKGFSIPRPAILVR